MAQTTQFNIKLTEEEKKDLEEKTKLHGFVSLAGYVKFLIKNSIVTVKATK